MASSMPNTPGKGSSSKLRQLSIPSPLAETAARIQAILQRAQSIHPDEFLNVFLRSGVSPTKGNGYAIDRPRSGVRANTKRTRSAAPAACSEASWGGSSELGRRLEEPDSPRSRLGSIELGLDNYHPEDMTSSIPCQPVISRVIPSSRSPSRGRRRTRDEIPNAEHPEPDRNRRHNKPSNFSETRKHQQAQVVSSKQTEYSASSDPNSHVAASPSYIRRGAFRLHKHRTQGEFRFPKSRSGPEPTWHAGDGFSDGEATPGFAFLMTGKHKRKRSNSKSTMGKLLIDGCHLAQHSKTGETLGQEHLKWLRGSQGELRRKEIKDIWPTKQSFADDSIVRKSQASVPVVHNQLRSSPSLSPGAIPEATMQVGRSIRQKRQASYFENFGRQTRPSNEHHNNESHITPKDSARNDIHQRSDDERSEE